MAEARRYESGEIRPYQDKSTVDWTIHDEWDWFQDYLNNDVIEELEDHDLDILKYVSYDWVDNVWYWRTRDDLPPLPEWMEQALRNDSRMESVESIPSPIPAIPSPIPGVLVPQSQAEIDEMHERQMDYISTLPVEPLDPINRYNSQTPEYVTAYDLGVTPSPLGEPPEYVTPPPVYKTPEFSPSNQPCRLNMCVNDAMPGSEFCSSCHGAKGRRITRRSARKPHCSRRKPRRSRKPHRSRKPRRSRKRSRRRRKGKIHKKKTRSK